MAILRRKNGRIGRTYADKNLNNEEMIALVIGRQGAKQKTTRQNKSRRNGKVMELRSRPQTRAVTNNDVTEIVAKNLEKLGQIRIPEFPGNLDRYRLAKGFPSEIRNFFLGLLPDFHVTGGSPDRYWCPWCMEAIPAEGMHVDHIIPKKIYARFCLYEAVTSDTPEYFTTRDANVYLREFLEDEDNLMLSCATCNTKKGDSMVTSDQIRNVLFNANKFANPSAINRKMYRAQKIRHIYGANRESLKKLYISTGDLQCLRVPEDDTLVNGVRFFSNVSLLESQIRGWGGQGSQPPFSPENVRAALKEQQYARITTGYEGKLCFYCLGFYHKSVFAIDHIRPTNGTIHTKESNNESGNLFPVCSPCNNKKSNHRLSLTMLHTNFRERQHNNLPGIEHSRWMQGNTDHERALFAFDMQRRLFVSKLELADVQNFMTSPIGDWLEQIEQERQRRHRQNGQMEVE